MLVKRWVRQEAPPDLIGQLCSSLGISPITAAVLLGRGVRDVGEAETFMRASLDDLHDPFLLSGMDRAVGRILKALRDREKIIVYGDYDADGITSTALLADFFRDLKKEIDYYIPGRMEEGYGLNTRALAEIKARGVGLVITVDCGISSAAEVEAARGMGMDVIVTDHHEPPETLPDAVALINPSLKGSEYPFRHLSGVGVALKLAQAVRAGLDGKASAWPGLDPSFIKYLDLVALGTIADVVPLKGENRALVKHGLEVLRRGQRPGVKKLAEVAKLSSSRAFGTGTVAFHLAPRLNASGRIGKADMGVRLMLTDDPSEALSIAIELDAMNRERQEIEEEILAEAREMACEEEGRSCRSLVLSSRTWHQGVVGIVASRLVEEFYKPTVLICMDGDTGKGSARSIPAFHLYDGLEKCAASLLAFGGHKYAAGLSIKGEMLGTFREQFESHVRGALSEEDFIPSVRIDGVVSLKDITRGLHAELKRFEPFGAGNPEPVLEADGLEAKYPKVVGKGHLKMTLAGDGRAFGAIGFGMGESCGRLTAGRARVDAAFCIDVNEWQGEKTLQLNLKDLRFS